MKNGEEIIDNLVEKVALARKNIVRLIEMYDADIAEIASCSGILSDAGAALKKLQRFVDGEDSLSYMDFLFVCKEWEVSD